MKERERRMKELYLRKIIKVLFFSHKAADSSSCNTEDESVFNEHCLLGKHYKK